MENHIDQIEIFLRGGMSLEEEDIFKEDARLRSYSFIVAYC